MADDFENRGYETIRYALEPPYNQNKAAIATCDITFIAVPTPTTQNGFDYSLVSSVLPLIGAGKIAVIKSTILPGTTNQLQKDFPDIYLLHSPEFLREASAAEDSAHPQRNIIGTPEPYNKRAEQVMATLPPAPYSLITSARNAECIKYIGNSFLYNKLVFMNIAHDFVVAAGGDWKSIREAVTQDERIGSSHTQVTQGSGRGAGGHCFIKDFEAFTQYYADTTKDLEGVGVLQALRQKNNALLLGSGKDIDLLRAVYGSGIDIAD